MSAAYQSTFHKQKRCKAIHPDANDSPVHLLEEWKRKSEKKKELLEERKEKAKRMSEITQQLDDCPCLRLERKNFGNKLGPYWALS